MDGESLEPDHVVAIGRCGGDRRRPRGVVVDHLARAPDAVCDGSRDQTGFVDLEPVERGGVCAGAVATAVLCRYLSN